VAKFSVNHKLASKVIGRVSGYVGVKAIVVRVSGMDVVKVTVSIPAF
jgi:glutamate formiminotransferase